MTSTVILIAPAEQAPSSGAWADWQQAGPRYVMAKALAGERAYWWPHIQRELFGDGIQAGRSVAHSNARLQLETRDAITEIRVDLLEHVWVRLGPAVQVGIALVHLQLDCPSERLVGVIHALREPLVRDARLSLITDGPPVRLGPSRPGLAAIGHLIDSVSPQGWLYTLSVARPPRAVDAIRRPQEQREWARALARATTPQKAAEAITRDPDKARRLELPLGPHLITVLGRGAGIALADRLPRDLAATQRYARSYWAEAVGFGILQLLALQRIAERMGALAGDPASRHELDDIHEEWLAFRQRLWWSSLSAQTAVPGEILVRFHAESPSRQLFDDLTADMETFVTRRAAQRARDQERALVRLQTGGAGLASAGVVAAALAVGLQNVDLSVAWRIGIPVAILAIAALVSWATARVLRH